MAASLDRLLTCAARFGAPAKPSRECERAVQSCGCSVAWLVTIPQKRLARHGAWVGVIARMLFVPLSSFLRPPRSCLLNGRVAGPLTDVRGSVWGTGQAEPRV